MDQITTLEERRATSPKPRKETIANILRFSRAYHHQELSHQQDFEMIKN